MAGASPPPSEPEPESVAGAGSAGVVVDQSIRAVESVVVPSVEARPLTAESSSVERTWSPAAAEKAAPATKSAENDKAIATRRRRERGVSCSRARDRRVRALTVAVLVPFVPGSPLRSLLIKEFRRGIAYRSVLSGVEAATSTRIL